MATAEAMCEHRSRLTRLVLCTTVACSLQPVGASWLVSVDRVQPFWHLVRHYACSAALHAHGLPQRSAGGFWISILIGRWPVVKDMVLLQAVMFTACQTAAVIAAILVFAPCVI